MVHMNNKYIVFGFLAALDSQLKLFSLQKTTQVKQVSDSVLSSSNSDSIWNHMRSDFKLEHHHSNAHVQKAAKGFYMQIISYPLF